jgi:6-pyruvoyltetrahydropterin/6-carboxytetrahydropterin synthase
MPFRICQSFDIESGHMLSKHPGNCRFPHGHTRKIEFVLEAEDLDENEMVCDFGLLNEVIRGYLDSLDHAMCMNTEDRAFGEMKACFGDRIVPFERQDPTTEVMAREIFHRCREALEKRRCAGAPGCFQLRSGVKLVSVRVWETASSWAEYSV